MRQVWRLGGAALAAAMSITAAPAATAQPPGAYWRGDICRQAPQPGGGGAVRCLSYPRRVEYHQPNCRWIAERMGGGWQQFEACRGHDGLWRPSGRS